MSWLRTPSLAATLLVLAACTTKPATPEPEPPASGERVPCSIGHDQTCNDDPKVSALWGRCTELGVCECKPGFRLAPWGRCTAP